MFPVIGMTGSTCVTESKTVDMKALEISRQSVVPKNGVNTQLHWFSNAWKGPWADCIGQDLEFEPG